MASASAIERESLIFNGVLPSSAGGGRSFCRGCASGRMGGGRRSFGGASAISSALKYAKKKKLFSKGAKIAGELGVPGAKEVGAVAKVVGAGRRRRWRVSHVVRRRRSRR
jgi:hypothetical protein